MFMSGFSSLFHILKCKLVSQYCCSFNGSPLCLRVVLLILHNYMCVSWRKALRAIRLINYKRCYYSIKSNFTQDNIPKAISSFINKCLGSNNLVVMISKLIISNPMSIPGCNYRNMYSLVCDINDW